jgi:hypothetical protein
MKKIILFSLFTFSFNAFCVEPRTLGRSTKGLLMGDAFTAVADDEYTLFYNPALLARHSGFSFTPFNPSISVPNVLSDSERFTDLGTDVQDIYSAAAGFPIHIGAGMAPGFKMGKFGLSAILNMQTNILLQNEVNPTMEIDHRYDKGFIMGYASPLSGSFSQSSGGQHLALGGSIKYINRESVYGNYYLLGTELLDALSAGEISDVLTELGQVNGQGWGFDLGLDYAVSNGPSTFTMGLAMLDIVTLLQTAENDDDREVQPQPMQVNFGTSWKGEVGGGFGLTVTADIRNLEQQMEFMKRIRLGGEISLSPALSLLAGLNGLNNYSYGLKTNLGLFKVFTGLYTEEVGEKLDQIESERFIIYFSLFSFNFDPGV